MRPKTCLVPFRRPLLAVLLAAAAALAAPGAAGAAVPAVQAHLTWSNVDAAEAARQLDAAKAAGAGLVRVDVGWRTLEAGGKGQYASWYVAKVDKVVDLAEARGLELLLTFTGSPSWASAAGTREAAPRNPRDYADALAWMVRRYGERVAAWEIWNEPNQDSFWVAPDPVGAYVALLQAAYPAAKAADPGATIVGGSLAESDFPWVEAMYQRGAKGFFDALSIHPYSGHRSPLDPNPSYRQLSFISGIPATREVMLRHGDDKPLWLTEFGWSTCNIRDREAWANCVDEPVQAAHLELAYAQLPSWPYVAVGVWFNLKDLSTDPGNRSDNRGLLRNNGTQKPAFAAFQRASALLRRALPSDGATSSWSGQFRAARRALGAAQQGGPRVRRVLRRAVVRRGARTVPVALRCPVSARSCRGVVTLSARRGGVATSVGAATVVLTRARTVRIRLSAAGRALAARRGRLAVAVSAR